MKVNFKQISCVPSLIDQTPQVFDFSVPIANTIYTKTSDMDDYNLAIEIFNAEGEVDITAEQMQSILGYIDDMAAWIRVGVIGMFNNALASEISKSVTQEDDSEVYEVDPGEDMMTFEDETNEMPVIGVPAGEDGVPAGEGGVMPAPDNLTHEVPVPNDPPEDKSENEPEDKPKKKARKKQR